MRASSVLLAAALIGLPPSVQASPPVRVEVEDLAPDTGSGEVIRQLEAQAATAFADGDLAHAAALYRQLAATHDQPAARAAALVTVGWIEQLAGHPEQADAALEEALFVDPELRLRSDLYDETFVRRFLDAQPRAQAARTREAAELARAGVQLIAAGNLEGARAKLEAALALQPDQPRTLYNLAVVDLRSERSEAALAGFERVLSLGQGRPDLVPPELRALASTSAGLLYLKRGDAAAAEAMLEQATTLTPGDGKTWGYLGMARQRTGKLLEASAALERARALRPDDLEILDTLARVQLEAGRPIEAAAGLLEATRRLPDAAVLWLRLGIAQQKIGGLEEAETSFRRVLALDAENRAGFAEQAAAFLALTLNDLGRPAEGAEMARRVLAWNGHSVDAWIYLGLAQRATGDLAGARQSLERAAALDPSRAETAYNLGSVALAAGDSLAAREYFLRALELQPAFPAAREILDRLDRGGAAPAAGTGRGAAARPGFGATLTEASYEEIGLKGLAVGAVDASGAAARAGIQTGDLLLRADGRPLAKSQDLLDLVRSAKRGQVVAIDLLRAGRPLRVSVRLD